LNSFTLALVEKPKTAGGGVGAGQFVNTNKPIDLMPKTLRYENVLHVIQFLVNLSYSCTSVPEVDAEQLCGQYGSLVFTLNEEDFAKQKIPRLVCECE
jgi:hypothetical protein